MKICLLWAVFDHRGYMWYYSEPRRVRLGTIGSMPTNFGNLPKVRKRQEASSRWVSQYWQVASVSYITYISVSKSTPLAVNGPHGQLASIYIFCRPSPIFYFLPLIPDLVHYFCLHSNSNIRAISALSSSFASLLATCASL